MLLNPPASVQLAVAVLLSLAAGALLSRRFTRPLARLAEGARALRSGHLDHRIPLEGTDEFGRVAVSMNDMAKRIEAQIAALEAEGRRRQQLLADVAHDLRSPVARLKTMAEAFRDGLASQPERSQRASQAMVESADRMERLVNDLLELARLDLHELPLDRQLVDLRALAADRLQAHREAAEKAGMSIQSVEAGDPVLVEGDRQRLAQVLDNLIANAVSYAGPGAELRVTVTPGDPAAVVVADTGRGIPAEHLPYVFDAFYRADPARTPGDQHSGLGLRIARGLAEAHGGALRVESAEGQGTRAILTLPRAGDTAP
jgi:signal transduction histidine kinase